MSGARAQRISRNDLLERAYRLDGTADAKALYEDWAETYDADLAAMGYAGPGELARIVADVAPSREVEILDLGCGAGLLGAELKALGYVRLDGCDLTPAMIAQARRLGRYRRCFTADLTARLPLPDAAYDVAVSIGVFTHGHVGPEAFRECLRVVRPGGLFLPGINALVFDSLGYRAEVAALEAAGLARCERLSRVPHIVGEGLEAMVPVLRKR